MSATVHAGDCREVLRTLPERSVQCVITSPPYFGLRDYGDPGQIGLEQTPDEFVAALVQVFREVRRVLRDDGTVWLNLGDSYSGAPVGSFNGGGFKDKSAATGGRDLTGHAQAGQGNKANLPGIKPKDLLLIPAMAAQALRAPYYSGTITSEADRRWLAAIIDAEGCIYISRSKKGATTGRDRQYQRTQDAFDVGVAVSQRSPALLHECARIVGQGRVREAGERHWEWRIFSSNARALLREVYPYLIGKKHEARLALGCPPSGEQATAAWETLKAIHQGGEHGDLDFPVPESLYERGWFLRSDIVWSKLLMPNPMPESVTDRPTRSHEYLFMLAKRPRYYFDADAIREPHEMTPQRRNVSPVGARGDDYSGQRGHRGMRDMLADEPTTFGHPAGRNKRSVWTVATQPFSSERLGLGETEHFAVFPRSWLSRACWRGVLRGRAGCAGRRGDESWNVKARARGRDSRSVERARTRTGSHATRRASTTRAGTAPTYARRARSAGSRHALTTTTRAAASSSTRSPAAAPSA
jgi:hypothetical protein